jgi:hypothetical protein
MMEEEGERKMSREGGWFKVQDVWRPIFQLRSRVLLRRCSAVHGRSSKHTQGASNNAKRSQSVCKHVSMVMAMKFGLQNK